MVQVISIVTYTIVGISVVFLFPIGIIAGVVLAIVSSGQADILKKKKLKKIMLWSFFGPLSLIIIVTIFHGLVSVIYTTIYGVPMDSRSPVSISASPIPDDGYPRLDSIYPNIATVGSKISIKGLNFSPVGDTTVKGWSSSPHSILRISNRYNQTAVLWLGNIPDKPETSAEDQIGFILPAKVCVAPVVDGASCPSESYMDMASGNYNIVLDVDGRGESNHLDLSIIKTY